MNKHPIIDTSNELLIYRHQYGVKLVRPDYRGNAFDINTGYSLSSLLNMPCNVYFLNKVSELQKINKNTAANCGFVSEASAVGKTANHISDSATATWLMNNDLKVIKTLQPVITDDNFSSLYDCDHKAVSLKFPLYNQKEILQGILGFSIVLENQHVSEALIKIKQMGLLDYSIKALPGKDIYNNYLSNREIEVLRYTLRGKTAKTIANNMGLSYRTVEAYLENIKNKMGVSSKIELVEKMQDVYL